MRSSSIDRVIICDIDDTLLDSSYPTKKKDKVWTEEFDDEFFYNNLDKCKKNEWCYNTTRENLIL